MSRAWAFIRLSRPHFLLGGFLMFALGSATAGALDAKAYIIGQLAVTASQLTAHYVNEWADLEADRRIAHRTLFSGGSGVLVEGLLPRSAALRAAWSSTAIAIGSLAVLFTISIPATLLGFGALIVSWIYSAPPVRLLATGWGEVATSLVVAGAVPLVGAFSQGGTPDGSLLASVGILFVVHLTMMLAFELPDLASDATAGKRVLAVRMGRRGTIVLISSLLTVAGAGLAALHDRLPGAEWAGLAGILPASVLLVSIVRRMDRTLTASAVTTLVAVAAMFLAGVGP